MSGFANPTTMIIDNAATERGFIRTELEGLGFDVVYDGRHGIDAPYAAEEHRPEVLFVAMEEPFARSMQIVDFMHNLNPGCAILAYGKGLTPQQTRRVMQAGATDLVLAPLSRKGIAQAAETVRRTLERQALLDEPDNGGRGGVYAVVGQKGGIGKTTISTNLAVTLASRTESSVLIIDLDTRFGDVALTMNMPAHFTAANAARSFRSMDRESFRSMLEQHESGAWVLPAPSTPREWLDVTTEDVEGLVRYASELFDYVVLDTPGTLDEMVSVAIKAATRVVAVTSLDLTSIKNTNLLLAFLEGHGIDRQQVVLTVSHNLERNIVTAQDVSNLLEKVVDFEVPFSNEIVKNAQLGAPIAFARPTTAPAHVYGQLASLVSGVSVHMPEAQARSFWSRLFGRQPATPRPIVPTSFQGHAATAGPR
jgi:pilus assembly protein CpaE